MRPSKASIVVTYLAAIAAVLLCITAWLNMADVPYATYCTANGCFLLLLGVWVHVCS